MNRSGILIGGTPEKFEKYLEELISISNEQGKEYLFLTAWNEWSERAYLEPDVKYGFGYLNVIKNIKNIET